MKKEEILKALVAELMGLDELHQEYQDNDTHFVIDSTKEGNTLTIKVQLLDNEDKKEFENWLKLVDDELFSEVLSELAEKEGIMDIEALYKSPDYKKAIDKVKAKTKEIAARKVKALKKTASLKQPLLSYSIMVSTGDSKSFSLGSNPSGTTMETTFKYKGTIITTPNLEKKLKRMKLSINDIEIIDNPLLKKKNPPEELEDYMKDAIKVVVRSNIDDIRRVCFIKKDKPRPTMRELFKNHIWNQTTKTGIREITEEYLMTLYYEN